MIKKTEVLEILVYKLEEWKNRTKGYNIPFHKFASYIMLNDLIKEIECLQQDKKE